MHKKTIAYKDYNGVNHTDDFYFHLTKPELLEMDLAVEGGYAKKINDAVASNDRRTLYNVLKEFVFKSYGEKSPDGRRFEKSDEISTAFTQTEAYAELMMELLTDENAASDFINALIPNDIKPA